MTFDPTTLRREDYGFFGPDSPSWKVWTSPTAVIGFQRAVTLEHFDPFLTAAVADTGKIYSEPRDRLDATFAYFLIVAIGDSRTAIQASEHLMTVHAKNTGIEPISGQRYSANSPETQLWIHITGWQSVLKAYEMFGPGLTPEEEAQYWRECRIAAELQTCKPEDVPITREGVRQYYADVRARLCTSEAAQDGMRQLLFTSPSAARAGPTRSARDCCRSPPSPPCPNGSASSASSTGPASSTSWSGPPAESWCGCSPCSTRRA